MIQSPTAILNFTLWRYSYTRWEKNIDIESLGKRPGVYLFITRGEDCGVKIMNYLYVFIVFCITLFIKKLNVVVRSDLERLEIKRTLLMVETNDCLLPKYSNQDRSSSGTR